MRLLIAKNSKRLKLLDQRGAEPQKIDATRNLLRKLSTKIRIAVRVIAKVSSKINKLRDEELWPQLNALIQGYAPLLTQGVLLNICHDVRFSVCGNPKCNFDVRCYDVNYVYMLTE